VPRSQPLRQRPVPQPTARLPHRLRRQLRPAHRRHPVSAAPVNTALTPEPGDPGRPGPTAATCQASPQQPGGEPRLRRLRRPRHPRPRPPCDGLRPPARGQALRAGQRRPARSARSARPCPADSQDQPEVSTVPGDRPPAPADAPAPTPPLRTRVHLPATNPHPANRLTSKASHTTRRRSGSTSMPVGPEVVKSSET
jgi:hypothetical protein